MRHVAGTHCLLRPLGEAVFGNLSFTGKLHNLKRKTGFKPFVHKVNHNTVTGTDNIGNCACARLDKLLCIAEPNIGTVGKSRNLQKVGEALGMCFN